MTTQELYSLMIMKSLVTMLLCDENDCGEIDTSSLSIRTPLYHYHKCDTCGRIWSHDPRSNFFGDYDEEHTCTCGREQYIMYMPTPEQAKVIDEAYLIKFGD